MSKVYKTPLYKSQPVEKKVGLEDLSPELADSIGDFTVRNSETTSTEKNFDTGDTDPASSVVFRNKKGGDLYDFMALLGVDNINDLANIVDNKGSGGGSSPIPVGVDTLYFYGKTDLSDASNKFDTWPAPTDNGKGFYVPIQSVTGSVIQLPPNTITAEWYEEKKFMQRDGVSSYILLRSATDSNKFACATMLTADVSSQTITIYEISDFFWNTTLTEVTAGDFCYVDYVPVGSSRELITPRVNWSHHIIIREWEYHYSPMTFISSLWKTSDFAFSEYQAKSGNPQYTELGGKSPVYLRCTEVPTSMTLLEIDAPIGCTYQTSSNGVIKDLCSVNVIPLPDSVLSAFEGGTYNMTWSVTYASGRVSKFNTDARYADGKGNCDVFYVDSAGDVVYYIDNITKKTGSVSEITDGQLTDIGNCLLIRNQGDSPGIVHISVKAHSQLSFVGKMTGSSIYSTAAGKLLSDINEFVEYRNNFIE